MHAIGANCLQLSVDIFIACLKALPDRLVHVHVRWRQINQGGGLLVKLLVLSCLHVQDESRTAKRLQFRMNRREEVNEALVIDVLLEVSSAFDDRVDVQDRVWVHSCSWDNQRCPVGHVELFANRFVCHEATGGPDGEVVEAGDAESRSNRIAWPWVELSGHRKHASYPVLRHDHAKQRRHRLPNVNWRLVVPEGDGDHCVDESHVHHIVAAHQNVQHSLPARPNRLLAQRAVPDIRVVDGLRIEPIAQFGIGVGHGVLQEARQLWAPEGLDKPLFVRRVAHVKHRVAFDNIRT